jgi:hypothetical protein
VRRALKVDAVERASIPEITTHSWLRLRHPTMFEALHAGPGRHDSSAVASGERPTAPPSLTITPVKLTSTARGGLGSTLSPGKRGGLVSGRLTLALRVSSMMSIEQLP